VAVEEVLETVAAVLVEGEEEVMGAGVEVEEVHRYEE